MYRDEFGFIPEEHTVRWTEGIIEPLLNFKEKVAFALCGANVDGFLYPPLVHRRSGFPGRPSQKVPRSDRPAFLYGLPVTHSLTLYNFPNDRQSVRADAAGFIIHFFGMLYGYRAQFQGWWIDGRAPVKSHSDRHLWPQDAEVCVERAFGNWQRWDARSRLVATNAMFLHNRATHYEWEWERFIAEYQVIDAAYALAASTHNVRAQGHAKRIKAMCDYFGIAYDHDVVEQIVRLRNDLIHEALWVGGMPGNAGNDFSFRAAYFLHKLTLRIILAICGIRGTYIGSPWWRMGTFHFDPQ